jgi:hypothetical protein
MKKALFGYLVLTIIITWPLILNMNGFLLANNFQDMSHSDLNPHIIRVNQTIEAVSDNKNPFIVDWIEVPITYTLLGMFFLNSEFIVFHNLFFFMSIFFSGICMYLFCYSLFKDKYAAFFSGALYISTAYIISEYLFVHSNLIQIFWIPLILFFIERLFCSNKRRDIILLGLALFFQNISCSQYTLYLSLILPIYLLLRFPAKKIKSKLKSLAIALIIASILSLPYLFARMSGLNDKIYGIRSITENLTPGWSINLWDIFNPLGGSYLTLIFISLFIIGTFLVFHEKKLYKLISFPVLSLFIILMMHGPRTYYPYYWFYRFWPFVNRYRVASRFFPIMMVFASVTASLFLIWLAKTKLKKHRAIIMFLLIILNLMMLFWASDFFNTRGIYFP